jgi:hypothetical protein
VVDVSILVLIKFGHERIKRSHFATLLQLLEKWVRASHLQGEQKSAAGLSPD